MKEGTYNYRLNFILADKLLEYLHIEINKNSDIGIFIDFFVLICYYQNILIKGDSYG